ncbi:DUF4760 domain-containing protein [Qipengyuania seohaensis]|uniref:DUF4760 domain-containing protein n=1 Tax=Qipengyuania seohaensis TaxID=266951 RepID=UPI0012FD63F2|nr:DUF4760 domain-containing protein [Qipengyuania seohaensis]
MVPIIAAGVAIWGVQTQRAIARRKATLDHLAVDNVDTDMIRARTTFIKLALGPGGLAPYADNDKEHSKEQQAIRLILNDFELVSTAIQFGIMDFEFYKQQAGGTAIRYWECAAPFVHAIRQKAGRNTLYCEFEALAGWISDDHKPKKRNRLWRKFF